MENNIVCPLCLGNPAYKKGYSFWNYDNKYVKHLIHMIKFQNRPELVKILFEFEVYIKSLDIFNGADFLIFVPMHKDDIKKRGYNQAAIITKTLSKITGIKIRYDLLLKIKRTKAQVGLDINQRIKNLTGAFRTHKPGNIKKVVIVDDVFTTGSTIKECAKTLNKYGIKSNFFTLAATPSNPGV